MTRRISSAWGLVVGMALLLASEVAQAQGLGWSTSPSTFWQCVGYGYGAGHHAPIVRTPQQEPGRQLRRLWAPNCYGQLGPAPYMFTGCSAERCPWMCPGGGSVGAAAPTGAAYIGDAASMPPSPQMLSPPMPPVDAAPVGRRQTVLHRWP